METVESITVAALQMNSQDDVRSNLRSAAALVEAAAKAGATVVVLPEAFAFLGRESQKVAIAERLDGEGPILSALRKWCRAWHVSLVAGGIAEHASEGPPYNSSVVLDPAGEVTCCYRKMHLFNVSLDDGTTWFESRGTSPGTRPEVAHIGGFCFGLSICYDLRFPELFAWQRRKGASVLTVPSAFTKTTGAAHWATLLRARAIETQCYVVAAAQEGEHPRGRETYGHACILDPWGRPLAERAVPGPGFVVARLEASTVDKVRKDMPMQEHRLPFATYQ